MPELRLHSAEVRALEAELRKGCGNHGCRFKSPVGMGTNGPCRCPQKIADFGNENRRAPSPREAAPVEALRVAQSALDGYVEPVGAAISLMSHHGYHPEVRDRLRAASRAHLDARARIRTALAAYEAAAEYESPYPGKSLDEMSRETAAIRRRLAAERKSDASD
jgi:hypothetical protein